MDTPTQQPRRIPNIRFRVLIIGRANAGKTSILQRICETTKSPVIHRHRRGGDDSDLDSDDEAYEEVSEEFTLDPSMDRGEHTIDDELVFSNHTGYIFHDSRGIESGCTKELKILQNFIRRKCGKKRLRDKLHAIWYCVPMDNQRPGLDLKFFKDICPDGNVPVIAVFTKYDQFRRNVQIDLVDYGNPDDNVTEVTEKLFQEHYLHPLGDHIGFVRLEQMHRKNRRCDDLIEKTAAALNDDAVALMLLAVRRGHLDTSVKMALYRVYSLKTKRIEDILRKCLVVFPYVWWFNSYDLEFFALQDYSASYYSASSYSEALDSFIMQVMSLPTIQNLSGTGLGDHRLVLAVILILKHATFLRLSNPTPISALTRAELDYREANIDSNVQQYLMTSYREQSVELCADFIMAIDIVPPQSSVENYVHR